MTNWKLMCGFGKKNNIVIRLLKNGMLVTITHNGNALCRWGFKARQPSPCTADQYNYK